MATSATKPPKKPPPPRLSTLNPSKRRLVPSTPQSAASSSLLSASEIHYILEGCRDNIRRDGRTRTECRDYTLIKTFPLVLSNGSARMLLPGGATHVLCSIKAELVHPSPSHPHEGVLEFHVDILKGGRREEQNVLQSLLEKLLKDHVANLSELVVVPNQYVWRLAIDVFVLQKSGGNLLTCMSRVIRQALQNTQLAHVTPITSTTSSTATTTADHRSGGGAQVDLTVDGDIQKATSVPGALQCPVIVTVFLYKCPPSHQVVMVVDATLEEEACAFSRIHVAVDVSGNVCALFNQGPLQSSLLPDVIATAVQASKVVLEQDDKNHVVVEAAPQDVSLLQDQFQFR